MVLAHIHLTNDTLMGNHKWKGNLNLFNVVMLGITGELPEHDKEYELHRLLSALFSAELSAEEKLDIIKHEYEIETDDGLGEEVLEMCNLSIGIKEKGIEEGRIEGRKEGKTAGINEMIVKLYRAGYPAAEIAKISGKKEEEIQEIIKNADKILA